MRSLCRAQGLEKFVAPSLESRSTGSPGSSLMDCARALVGSRGSWPVPGLSVLELAANPGGPLAYPGHVVGEPWVLVEVDDSEPRGICAVDDAEVATKPLAFFEASLQQVK